MMVGQNKHTGHRPLSTPMEPLVEKQARREMKTNIGRIPE